MDRVPPAVLSALRSHPLLETSVTAPARQWLVPDLNLDRLLLGLEVSAAVVLEPVGVERVVLVEVVELARRPGLQLDLPLLAVQVLRLLPGLLRLAVHLVLPARRPHRRPLVGLVRMARTSYSAPVRAAAIDRRRSADEVDGPTP